MRIDSIHAGQVTLILYDDDCKALASACRHIEQDLADCHPTITSHDRNRKEQFAALHVAFEALAVAVVAQQHAGVNDPVTLAHIRGDLGQMP